MSRHLIRSAFVAALIAVLVLISALGPTLQPAAAQDASLSVSLTASARKAKVGDFVKVTVQVENTGTDTIPALSVTLILPDALDSRSVNCPGDGDNQGIMSFCPLGDFAPGSVAEVQFFVEVSHKEVNGPITAWVSSDFDVIATARIAPLKIIGPSRG
jgi:uncharacterized repeat protein (TIGR01451 family)